MPKKNYEVYEVVKGYYRAKRSYFATNKAFIAEGAICQLVEEITVRPRIPLVKKYLYAQGCLQRLASFQKLFDDNVLQEVEAPSDEFINEWVREPSSLKTLRKKLDKLQEKIRLYLKIEDKFNTLATWSFYSKGNAKAATQKEEKAFQNNPEKVLKETVLRGGMKAKPGGAHKNRSLRTTPACNEDRWMQDETTLLSNGIEEEERASFSEQEKILLKLIQEVANMYDCPDEILCLIKKDFGIEKQDKHCDYLTGEPISIQEFCKNEHHSKTNGVEFCHINPLLQSATNVNNVTIGTCSANRMQGGYTIEQHFKTFVGYAIRNDTFESWYADVLKQENKLTPNSLELF
tara:strand:+ start:2917 stop:3957 length:1041 start_codon:yes stop_codon:yes gene_type:complete